MAIDFQGGTVNFNTFNRSLVTGYALSTAELSNLNSYFWSDSIIDVLNKTFSNISDSIVSLHIVPFIETAGREQNTQIKIGTLNVGNCTGTKIATSYAIKTLNPITITPQYNSYLDYEPYTKVTIYLPFIGYRSLETSKVMGKAITVRYTIDVLSGGLNVQIKVGDNVLYNFEGAALIRIPLIGRDFSGVVDNVLQSVTSLASGNVGGLVNSVYSGFRNGINPVDVNYQVGGSSAFYAPRQVHIIMQRPVLRQPSNYSNLKGIPSMQGVALNNTALKGFCKVDSIHLENVSATSNELSEIESILKEGIII